MRGTGRNNANNHHNSNNSHNWHNSHNHDNSNTQHDDAPTAPSTNTDNSSLSSLSPHNLLLNLINDARASADAPALHDNSALDSAASAHTSDMLDNGFFDHVGSAGDDPGDRLDSSGYDWRGYGENIAWVSDSNHNGQADTAEILRLNQNLMNSPDHHANIVNPSFSDVGLGISVANGKVMLTEDFGRPASNAPHTTDTTTTHQQPTDTTDTTDTTDPANTPSTPHATSTDMAHGGPADIPQSNQTVTSGSGDLPAHNVVVHEAFDNGTGQLSNNWGNVDTSTPGEVHITSNAGEWQDGGVMWPGHSPDSGMGYGLYEFELSFNKQGPGGYALLWPGSDQWPGSELDLVEVHGGGDPYTTVHFNDGGNDAEDSYSMPNIDVTQPHTYAINWQDGYMDFYVDGQQYAHATDHVPKDFAHGGENETPSFGVQTWWNEGDQGGTDFVLTAYDFKYSEIA